MRRPQGFDGPPPVQRQSAAEPARAAESTRPATGIGAGAPRAADATDTEPIPVVVGVSTVRGDRAGSVGAANEPKPPAPAVGDPSVRSSRLLERDVTAETRAADEPGPIDLRASKRAISTAERERRKYERNEMRRFTQRSRRRRLAWLIGTASVVVLAGAIVGAAYSPLMALREVRIEGAQRIPVDSLEAAFARDLGTPLPLVTSADVRRALADFPLIETYATETIPPSTLVVRIVERTPVGVVQTDGGLELVDAAGVVIDRPAERPDGEPLIEAGPVASAGFRAAAAVVRSLPADVRGQVVHVTAATADDVRLELAGGASVVWGSAEHSQTKAASLAALMVSSPPDSVDYYDVSAPLSPVTG